ncbi:MULTISPECIES: 30S ribosomal protein S21 [Tenacibaculum]|uniref:Small ribosomal subunit protein bS21 n=1 Tax=Tenacibaculum jejuense TaxID=584609 RepID=A0A238U9M9_9FLAO|nr:30S ribosomal protein S21 [Tenacibaculum jejuense]SNR15899.1 30S ribosomal protein S21 family protein [Tenacibaculum jejuense]
MLIIKVKDGENIDRALKRYRKKFKDTKLLHELRGRREYVKESVRRREEVKKAEYKQQVLLKDN